MRAGVQGEGRRAVDGVARLVFVGDQGGRTGRRGSGVAAETRQSAGDAMAELKGSRAEVARLGRVNGILTAASASFRG